MCTGAKGASTSVDVCEKSMKKTYDKMFQKMTLVNVNKMRYF